MRNDIRAACPACDLRLPAGLARCPRCGGATATTLGLPAERPPLRDELRKVRPVRDAFLYVPLAVGGVAGVAGSLFLSGFLADVAEPGTYGIFVAVVPIAFIASLLGAGILLFFAWLPWALLVFLVFAFLPHEQAAALQRRVDVLPFADLVASRRAASPGAIARGLERLAARPVRNGAIVIAVWSVVQVAAFVYDGRVKGTTFTAGDVLAGIGGAVLIEGIMLTMLVAALRAGWQGVTFVVDRLRLVATWARRRAEATEARDPERARERLSHERTPTKGRIVLTDAPLRSPLGDRPCVGYRLRGRVGNVEIDDVVVSPFFLATGAADDQTRVRVDVSRLVVLDDEVDDDAFGLAPVAEDAQERLAGFFAERGLTPRWEDARLGEALLEERTEALVWGGASRERAPGEGYRDGGERTVLGPTDGLPVLLVAHPRPPAA